MDSNDLFFKTETSLYYDLFVPDDAVRPMPLMIAVHGYGAHKRYMMREAKSVVPKGWAIASIQAPHQHFRKTDDGLRVGFGWLTDFKPQESVNLHHDLILRLIAKLEDEGIVDTRAVFLYGFSQACALNFRFAFTYPQALKGIIGVCGGIPGDLETNEIYRNFKARTLYLYGDDDEFYSNEKFDEFETKLRTRLPDFTSRKFRAGHEITEEMRDEIRKFLVS